MTKYAGEVIIKFLSGEQGENVKPIDRAADGLSHKWKASKNQDVPVIEFVKSNSQQSSDSRTKLAAAIANLPKNSRVYLVGHGDKERDKIGGWKYDDVANLLKECNLTEDKTGIISIVACQGALGPLAWNPDFTKYADDALDNFAGKFHKHLGTGEKPVKCRVFGRVFNVQVINSQQHFGSESQFSTRYKGKEDAVLGRKITRSTFMLPKTEVATGQKAPPGNDVRIRTGHPELTNMPNYSQKQTESKREYYWDGNEQRWRWVTYDDPNVQEY